MPARDEEETTIFAKLKHAYLNFVEGLREKGVPLPHFIVPLVIILIIATAVIYAQPGLLVEKKQLSLQVKDNLGRPVPEATVQLLGADQQVIESKTADASGRAQFDSAPLNGAVRVSAEGFASAENSVATLVGQRSPSVSLRSTRTATHNIEVKVVDQSNQPVDSAFVTITFADGSLAPQATTNAAGSALSAVQESQLNDGTIAVEAVGFKSMQQPVTRDALQAGLPITVKLEPAGAPAANNGTFTVHVSSASNPVRGARVVLVDQFTDAQQAGETTSADGAAVFENIAFGSVLGVKVNAAGFAPFNREFTFTADKNEFEAVLQQRTGGEGQLTLTVVNDQASPLAGAKVNVFDSGSNKLLGSGETDQTGVYSLDLAAGVTAYATAYVDGFFPGFADSLTPGAGKTISLSPATAGSVTPITVEVREDGFPASGAEVSLYRSGGFFLGLPPLHAGAQGLVNATIPLKFDSASYRVFATASKAGLSGQSELADVSSEPLSLAVDLIALPANVTVTLKDLSTKNTLQAGGASGGGTVESRVAGITISSCNVDASGSCTLTVTPNKPFTLYASAPGYLSYSSAQTGFSPGDNANLTLELFPVSLAQGATATFLGLFGSSGAKVREVSNAETYTARFAVTMPQNVENAGFYLRAGDEPSAEGSAALITAFDSNGASYVQASTQFNPASTSCYTGETVASGAGLKWVYLSFPRGFVGTKEISAQVQVSRSAASGEDVALSYRAFGFRDNLPLLAPSDSALLDSLRQKVDQGQRLTAEDTCAAQLSTQRVSLTSQTLQCVEQGDAELCYKVSLSDSTARGSATTFQATLGRDVAMELELLSSVAIDSAALRTSAFRVSGARQTLVGARLDFANGDGGSTAGSGATGASQAQVAAGGQEGQTTNVPFVTVQNRKGKLTLTLSPLLSTQSASLAIVLRSGDKVYELPLTLAISGTNTFSVSAAPQRIPAAEATKVSVLVRDRNSNPVSDATVSFYECSGSPLGGSEPSEVIGDGTLNNGANGRYRAEINPTGLGEIGVRVEKDGFKTFEQCLLTVEGRNFISVQPDNLQFTGSSQDAAPQQVTVTNKLSEPVRVTGGINCGSDPVPLSVFPSSFTIEPNSDSLASVKVIPNVTANVQCIVTFNARAGLYRAVVEVPVSVNVQCPLCTSPVPATGSAAKPLPSTITLFVDPVYLQDAYTIPLALANDPTCRLDGFRINYGGSYAGGYGAYGGYGYGVPIQRGVLQGLPAPANWYCAACQPGGNGPNNCYSCSAQIPNAFACGSCTPTSNPGAPTSSEGVIFDQATCNSCYNGQGLMQAQAFGAPLTYRGYPVQFNPAVQCVGRDPTVGGGGFYRDDCGGPQYNRFAQFGILPPSLPGSSRYQTFSNYNYGHGPSREALREALQVEQCARDGITVAADFTFLGQVFPGSGTLFVTLPDGSSRQIRVLVAGGGYGYGGGLNLAPGAYEEKCGISSFANIVELGSDYKLREDLKFTLTCKIPFEDRKFTLKKADGTEIPNTAGCSVEATQEQVNVKCDLSQNQQARQVLDSEHRLYLDVEMSSNQDPNAKVAIHIGLNYPGGPAPVPQGGNQQPTQPSAPPATGTAPSTAPQQATAPQLPIDIEVCKASDQVCDQQHSLCNGQVQLGTALKIQYTLPPGDDASQRKIEIFKGTNSERVIPASDLTAQSGSVGDQRNAVGSYGYVLSSQVQGSAVSARCDLNVVQGGAGFIQKIRHVLTWSDRSTGLQTVFNSDNPAVATVANNVFLDNANALHIFAELDYLALRAAYPGKTLKVVKTFTCTQNQNYKLYSFETLTPRAAQASGAPTANANPYAIAYTSGATLKADGERDAPFSALLFSYCVNSPLPVDSEIPYTVKVQVMDGANLITEKYEGTNGVPVDSNAALQMKLLAYPEVPAGLPATPQVLSAGALDQCGRNPNSPPLSALNVLLSSSGAPFHYVKSTDTVSANSAIFLSACTKGQPAGRSLEFYAELTTTSGAVQEIPLGSPCTALTSPTPTCTVQANPNFLTVQQVRALNIDLAKGMKIKAKLKNNGNLEAERYFCKYWPNTPTECASATDANVITFPIQAVDLTRFAGLPDNCIVDPTRNNRNVWICDVAAGEAFDLANGMHFRVSGFDYSAASLKLFKYRVFQPTPDNEELDCDPDAVADREAEVSLAQTTPGVDIANPPGFDCSDGPTKLPLVKVRVLKVLGPNDAVLWAPSQVSIPARLVNTRIVRIRINTLFGATERWLNEFLPEADGIRVIDSSTNRVVHTGTYHATPDQRLPFLTDPRQGVYILAVNDVAKITDGKGGILRYTGRGSDARLGAPARFIFEARHKDKSYVLECGDRTYQYVAYPAGAVLGAATVFAACATPLLDLLTCPAAAFGIGAGVGTGAGALGAANFDFLVENILSASQDEAKGCTSTETSLVVKPLRPQYVRSRLTGQNIPGVCVVIASEANRAAVEQQLGAANPSNLCVKR